MTIRKDENTFDKVAQKRIKLMSAKTALQIKHSKLIHIKLKNLNEKLLLSIKLSTTLIVVFTMFLVGIILH